jgi:hypothetical protein
MIQRKPPRGIFGPKVQTRQYYRSITAVCTRENSFDEAAEVRTPQNAMVLFIRRFTIFVVSDTNKNLYSCGPTVPYDT